MKNYMTYIICVFFTLYASCQTPTKENIPKNLEGKIDSIFQKYNNPKTPGIAIGIIKKGDLIFDRGYGIANLEYNIPVSDSTVFTLCSVSKQFTILGIMLLVEKGLISLNDDIRTYVPELPDYGNVITLRHLANNTSGLRSNLQLLGLKGYIADDMINQRTVDEIIFKQRELNFAPGEEYNYSNSGFVLLAKVIEKVSRQSFSSYMKENIFNPLNMDDTFVMDNYQKVVKNKASSYEILNNEFVFAPSNYSYVGASGIYTTLKDFSKWAANFANAKVGNQKIFNEMSTKGILNNGKESFYALGQIVQDYHGLKRIWHSGADAGYRSYIGRFPDQKISIILLSNNASVHAEGEALKVANIFLEPFYDKNDDNGKQENQKFHFINLPLKQKEKLTGHYLSKNYEVIRNIEIQNDTLFYIRANQGNRKSSLKPINEKRFVLGSKNNVHVSFEEKDVLKVLVNNKEVETYFKYTPKTYTIKELQEFTGKFYSDELETTYELKIEGDNLVIWNSRIGSVKINPLKRDTFLGTSWIFNSLFFERNEKKQITGLRVSGQRIKNIYFEKVK